MLESSDKFYSEVRKPRLFGADGEYCNDVPNCYKVLMEPAGIASIDGGRNKEYKSWPEYCKTHKFISSLSGPLPDMILPAYFKQLFPEVTDAMINLKKGISYMQ